MPGMFTKPAAPPPSGGSGIFDRWLYLFWKWVLQRLENFFPVITGVANNDLLQYDSTSGTWINRNHLRLSEIADPGLATANEAWIHAEDVAGFTNFHINYSDTKQTLAQDLFIIARNTSGGSITKSAPVYVSGSTGSRPEVAPAYASLQHHALGVAMATTANNGYLRVMTAGLLTALDTSAWTAGTRLYLGEGVLTSTQPAHPAAAQAIGVVIYQHANQGIIFVFHHEDMRDTDGSHSSTFTIPQTLYMTTDGILDADENAADPATPTANRWKLYFKAGGAYIIDDAGVVTGPLGPAGGSISSEVLAFAARH